MILEQLARVIAIEGDDAIVLGGRASACGGCAGKSSCSTLGSWQQRLVELRVKNRLFASIGDEVMLEVPDGLLLRVTFKLYMVPMLLFIGAGLLGRSVALALQWNHAELIAVGAGLLAVIATFMWHMVATPARQASLDIRMSRLVHRGATASCDKGL